MNTFYKISLLAFLAGGLLFGSSLQATLQEDEEEQPTEEQEQEQEGENQDESERQEVDEQAVLDSINEQAYIQAEHGLEDISAQVQSQMTGNSPQVQQQNQMMSNITLQYRWVSPNKTDVEATGLDSLEGRQRQMAQRMVRQLQNQFESIAGLLVINEPIRDADYTQIYQKGDNYFIEQEEDYGTSQLVFGNDYRLKRMISDPDSDRQQTSTMEAELRDVGEEYLVQGLSGTIETQGRQGGTREVTIEYAVDNFEEIELENGDTVTVGTSISQSQTVSSQQRDMSRGIQFDLNEVEVNSGIEIEEEESSEGNGNNQEGSSSGNNNRGNQGNGNNGQNGQDDQSENSGERSESEDY